MDKSLKSNQLDGRKSGRTLLAVSLAVTLAAFGCTTDRNVGDGTPVTTPGLRGTPTGGAATGTQSTPQSPPMYSSSSARFDSVALPAVRPRRVTPDEAALIAAEMAPRVRVLGPAYPAANTQNTSAGLVTGQWVNPAMQTNPQLTINSSLTSNPTAGIASGAGDAGGGVTSGSVASTTLASSTTTGSSLGTTTGAAAILGGTNTGSAAVLGTTSTNSPAATANTGAGVTGNSIANVGSTAGTPVFNTATTAASVNALASRTLSPTAASVVNPPTTISASPALASAGSRTTLTPATTTSNATATTTNASATGNVVNPVRLVTGTSGRRTITNQ
jgi:hypothetical protein